MHLWFGLLAAGCTESSPIDSGDTGRAVTDLPAGYAFASRDGSGVDSVAYDGQTLRHMLVADLSDYLEGLTYALDTGSLVPTAGTVRDEVLFFLAFDSTVGDVVPHRVSTDPAPLQTTYGEVSTGKDLFGKLAGNDSVTDHRDWTTEFGGWPGAGSPEALVRSWVDAIDAAAVDRANGVVATDPDGAPLPTVYLDAEGRDYKQLLEKLLRSGIAFSQGTDDYLDDDVDGKGLLADHSALAEGAPYTSLEHQWDEGFGYFGASRAFDRWTTEQRTTGHHDTDGDGAVDLLEEKAWHAAINAAKRDAASVTGTTLAEDAFDALYAGRALLASTTGALTDAQLDELRGHRDAAVLAWEQAIAATVIHYLNEVVADQDRLGSSDYVFTDHAKHWSEAKGFAFAFQFNPRSPMTETQFEQLHDALGTAPVLDDTGPVSLADYRAGLVQARDLLGMIFEFDAKDVSAW